MSVYQEIASVAVEYGVDVHLLASLIWAESSFRSDARSAAGAMGLGQIMPATWAEWSIVVGVSDPYDVRSNLRVSAAYLAWLLRFLKGDARAALHAYNFGVGNVAAGRTIPDETRLYAEKIIHGADLLRAVLKGE